MIMTFFIRDNNNSYPEPCDVASTKIIKNKKTFYFGALWGVYKPTDAIEYLNADEETFNWYEWLKSLGYDIVNDDIIT